MRNPIFIAAAFLLLPFFIAFPQSGGGDTADAEYLDVTHEYILHADGSTTYNYEHHLKLRSYFSFNRAYGESFILYNPAWQKLKIRASETVMAGGKKVSFPFNALNEVLPQFCAGAAPYAHLREMVVTHTGLERDAVVHLAYTIETKAGMLPGLTGKVVCGERSPIRTLRIVLRTPGNTPLMYAVSSPDPRADAPAPLPDPVATLEPEGTSSPVKQNVCTWTIENIPLVPVESAQPPLEQCVPVLFFTTATRMQAVRHVMEKEKDLYALSPENAARVAELAGGGKSELESALALRAYVENSVGSMSGNPALLGYHPLRAQETWDRNVGSALDRAVLLAAMLRSAGFEAAPLLASDFTSFLRYAPPAPGKPGGAPVRNGEELACLPAFAKAAVVCRLKSGEGILLDPNAPQPGRYPAKFIDKPYMVLSENSYSIDRLFAPPRDNMIRNLNRWTLNPDLTLTGGSVVSGGGTFSAAFQRDQFAAAAKRRIEASAQGLTAKLENLTIHSDEISTAGFSISSGKPLEAVGGLLAIPLPVTPSGLNDLHLPTGSVSRSTILDLPSVFGESDMTTILLPRNITLAVTPALQEISNDLGVVQSAVTVNDLEVTLVRNVYFRTARITPDRYEQFRTLINAWSDPGYQKLHFEARRP